MSLQCPSTIVVARVDGDVRALADGLRDRRVAAVYTGAQPASALTGRRLADDLRAVASTLPGLDRELGAVTDRSQGARAQLADDLRSVADLHRGETVVVLARTATPAGWTRFEIEIGDDGVRFLSGPGESQA